MYKMPKSKLIRFVYAVFMSVLLSLPFNNCAQNTESSTLPNTDQATSSRPTDDINTFKTNPPPMQGNEGFQFLLDQYFAPHCGSCHNEKLYFGAAFFELNNRQKSYDLSVFALKKQDMIMRVTNNPFCPSCTLDPNKEVYKAIMQWLDHRE